MTRNQKFALFLAALIAVLSGVLLFVGSTYSADDYAPDMAPTEPQTVYDNEADHTDDVPERTQLPYMAACEPCALQIMLNAYGVSCTLEDVLKVMPYGDDFTKAYWGNVETEGAAWPKPMVETANAMLDGTGYKAVDLTGISQEALTQTVRNGSPVMIWYTTDYQEPVYVNFYYSGEQLYSNEHCIVLYGVGDDYVHISDPLRGLVTDSAYSFWRIFEDCGSMAVGFELE